MTFSFVQKQALETLKHAVESAEQPVFPCALIAGDVVILDLLSKLDYLKSGRVKVVFIDTFHLFPETHKFLHQLEVTACILLNPVLHTSQSDATIQNFSHCCPCRKSMDLRQQIFMRVGSSSCDFLMTLHISPCLTAAVSLIHDDMCSWLQGQG